MKNFVFIILGIIIGSFSTGAILLYEENKISTIAIDSDIQTLEAELIKVQNEAKKYAPSLMLTLLNAQYEMLKTTITGLQQKRKSLVHRVSYNYTASIPVQFSTNNKDKLENDIKAVKEKIRKSELEAALYSGGLVQAMLIAQIATEKLTLSQLEQELYYCTYAIPYYLKQESETASTPLTVPHLDKDAL